MCNMTVFCLETAVVKGRLTSEPEQKPVSTCITEHFGSHYAKSRASQQISKRPAQNYYY